MASNHARDTGADASGALPFDITYLKGACIMAQLLMPKATAVWLVDNTALTFHQIANFCGLHHLEVKAIADGESAQGIKGLDPINTGQLSRDEIERAEMDPAHPLKLSEPKVRVPQAKKKAPRYTPVSKRQDRPNAILWLVRNHPELKDAQISRLVGTTKNTIEQIRTRGHWNSANLQPVDPVALGLCTQIDLDFEVQRASRGRVVDVEPEAGDMLLPATQTETMPIGAGGSRPAPSDDDELDADTVFAKLKALKRADTDADEETDDNRF